MKEKDLIFEQVCIDDLDICHEIESLCYGEEGATREKIQNRIKSYPEGFYILRNGDRIVGFVNGVCTDEMNISDEGLKDLTNHTPEGKNLVMLSVAVHPTFQKQGYSSILINKYIEHIKTLGKEKIVLMCVMDLIAYYDKFGFCYMKKSDSRHGGLEWHEMCLDLINDTKGLF